MQSWLKEARDHGNEDMSIILVGNKCDRESARNVSTEEGQRFAS